MLIEPKYELATVVYSRLFNKMVVSLYSVDDFILIYSRILVCTGDYNSFVRHFSMSI